ncbi:MAG TPA: alpha/beta hydrolase domain-containing protein [Vicinamibacterales bacterium]|nr:alpha/beta hydrolase domain-containing protein [Vicinamibacterales bacterium]
MSRARTPHWLIPPMAAIVFFCAATMDAQESRSGTPVVIPKVTGPIPVTADSYPSMAASKLQDVVDLPARGYVEEEFFVSGAANVYDWNADGSLTVKMPNAPYTTRILVRRPADPARFSGTAIVEMGNNARRYDWGFTWSLSYDHFLEKGDAWVLLTYVPAAVDALKQFNATRYAPLSFANPAPGVACAPDRPASSSEEGLRWDMISQVGALLKSGGAPLAGFRVERLYATSHGGELPTYVTAVHPHARLANGRPVYDGFVIHRYAGLARINQCAAAPAATDARQITRNAGVPVIRIVAQTDVLGTYQRRRADSDERGDAYRLYEVAGAPHADAAFYRHIPSLKEQTALGTQPFLAFWPFGEQCTPEIPLMEFPVMRYTVDAAFANLDRWVRDGIPAPKAARIEVKNGGTPQAALATDQFGNAIGGVRSPYLDVPTATYFASTQGPGTCGNLGHKDEFSWQRLETVYGSSAKYTAKFNEAIDRLMKERWLTESDAKKVKAEVREP